MTANGAGTVRRARYVLAGLVLMTVGTLGALARYPRTTAPQEVVASYFRALQAGDAPLALSFAQPPHGDTRYLSSAVLRAQAALGPISALDIGTPYRKDGATHVHVSYHILVKGSRAAQRNADDVVLHEHGRRWLIDRATVPVRITLGVAAERATLAGFALPTATVELFPGALPVRFDDALLSAEPSARTLSLTSADPVVNVEAKLNDQAMPALRTALSAAMNRCLQLATRAAPDCPLTPTAQRAVVVPRSLRGTVSALTLSHAEVTGPSGLVNVTGRISVRGTYQLLDFENLPITKQGVQSFDFTAALYGPSRAIVKWTPQ